MVVNEEVINNKLISLIATSKQQKKSRHITTE